MVNKTVTEQLERIKKNIFTSYMHFKDNYKRYHYFRNFVFKESINEGQRRMLQSLGRPVVEFNILESYISRLLGEFAMQEPSIEASPSEGIPISSDILDFVEGHIRHILYEADKDSFSYETYKNSLSGGFSVAKVWTDYSSTMSFNQQLYLGRCFDPTLCGFDPMARAPHKGDGNYSFEIFPMTEEDFTRKYPDAQFKKANYARDIEGFNWSFKNDQNQSIILVAEYFEKKRRRTKIVKLANGRVMTAKNYEKLAVYWEEQQFIEQLPVIVGNPRFTELETICRYELNECEILGYTETDYTYLPHVFIDGHSINLTDEASSNNTYQMTRPYVYHAKGIQDLKNFAGQSLANYLENMIQHKFIVKKEAIPQEQDYLEALNDIQRANTVVVNAFSDNDPTLAIPDPIREVVNVAAPPEVMGAFQITDPTTQAILGSFASNLGKNDNDLSGKAVIESASVGNAAAMPYVVGYLTGLNQIANIIVDLIPKYLVGKRSIPVLSKQGKKEYQSINQPGGIVLDYDEKAIHVNVEAGTNFQVQRSQALQQITSIMGASPEFAAFMNSPEGLPILVKNITCYSSDELIEAVPVWVEKQEKQKQEAQKLQQQAMQQDPAVIKAQAEMAKIQMQNEQNQVENQLKMAELQIDKEIAQSKLMEAESKVTMEQINASIKISEQETSHFNHEIDAATKIAEIQYREHQKELDRHNLHLEHRKLDKETNNKME